MIPPMNFHADLVPTMFKTINLSLHGAVQINPFRYSDERGEFAISFESTGFSEAGIHVTFNQDSISTNKYGVLRGLHYQCRNPIAHLVQVAAAKISNLSPRIKINSGPRFLKELE